MVDIYIEGGGDANLLRTNCRKGFRLLFEKCGFSGRMPKLHACGGRADAFDDFCIALGEGKNAMLLIDSEDAVLPGAENGTDSRAWDPWLHLAKRKGDEWKKPDAARELDCHLMVQCMETWFLADKKALMDFYGKGFKGKKLPNNKDIENIPKAAVYACISEASKESIKGEYSKGGHSFSILERMDPVLIRNASKWAERLFAELEQRLR